jgi:hypothetical protein
MTWLSQIIGAIGEPFKWWVVVAPWENGLRIRLGKVAAELCPGVHFRIPFLDRIYLQSMRLRTISDTGQTLTLAPDTQQAGKTIDGKVVVIAVSVEYGIKSLLTLYGKLANPENVILTRVAALIAKKVSSTQSKDLTLETLEAGIADDLPAEEWGLDRVKVYIVGFAKVRTYRLLNTDYRNLTDLNEMEKDKPK